MRKVFGSKCIPLFGFRLLLKWKENSNTAGECERGKVQVSANEEMSMRKRKKCRSVVKSCNYLPM